MFLRIYGKLSTAVSLVKTPGKAVVEPVNHGGDDSSSGTVKSCSETHGDRDGCHDRKGDDDGGGDAGHPAAASLLRDGAPDEQILAEKLESALLLGDGGNVKLDNGKGDEDGGGSDAGHSASSDASLLRDGAPDEQVLTEKLENARLLGDGGNLKLDNGNGDEDGGGNDAGRPASTDASLLRDGAPGEQVLTEKLDSARLFGKGGNVKSDKGNGKVEGQKVPRTTSANVDGGRNKGRSSQFESRKARAWSFGECKFYMTTGRCKYGDDCRYSHSKLRADMKPSERNFLGLPMRPGKKECAFYMRNGSCALEDYCRFHHPNPTVTVEDPMSTSLNGQSGKHANGAAANDSTATPSSKNSNSDSSSPENLSYHKPSIYPLLHGAPDVPFIYEHQPIVSVPESTMNGLPAHVLANSLQEIDPSGNHLGAPTSEEFSERPGLAECDCSMKSENCSFQSDCSHPLKSSVSDIISDGSHYNVLKESAASANQLNQPPVILMENYPEQLRSWNPESSVPIMLGVECDSSGMNPTFVPEVNIALPPYPSNFLIGKSKIFKHHKELAWTEELGQAPDDPESRGGVNKNGSCNCRSKCQCHHRKHSSNRGPASTGCNHALDEKGLPLETGL